MKNEEKKKTIFYRGKKKMCILNCLSSVFTDKWESMKVREKEMKILFINIISFNDD